MAYPELPDLSIITHPDSSVDSSSSDPMINDIVSDSDSIAATTTVEDLKQATDNILCQSKLRYDKVTAFVVSWPETLSDCQHISRDAKELCRVLEKDYRFDVIPYTIPEHGSHWAFSGTFLNLVISLQSEAAKRKEQLQDKTSLFILYYGGRAVVDQNSGKMIWKPSLKEKTPQVRWSGSADNISDVDMDILLLMDCCHAGAVIDTVDPLSFKQKCEAFCACGPDTKASRAPKRSFTGALANELREHAHSGHSCEISYLHALLNLAANKATTTIHGLEVDPWWYDFARQQNKPTQPPISFAPLDSVVTFHQIRSVSTARVVSKASFKVSAAFPCWTTGRNFSDDDNYQRALVASNGLRCENWS